MYIIYIYIIKRKQIKLTINIRIKLKILRTTMRSYVYGFDHPNTPTRRTLLLFVYMSVTFPVFSVVYPSR